MRGGSLLLFFALVLFFPLPSDQIGGGFLVCYFFLSFSSFICFLDVAMVWKGKACVCDHGFERSDLCAEIIIIIIIIIMSYQVLFCILLCTVLYVVPGKNHQSAQRATPTPANGTG